MITKQEYAICIIFGYTLYITGFGLIVYNTNWQVALGIFIVNVTMVFMTKMAKERRETIKETNG